PLAEGARANVRMPAASAAPPTTNSPVAASASVPAVWASSMAPMLAQGMTGQVALAPSFLDLATPPSAPPTARLASPRLPMRIPAMRWPRPGPSSGGGGTVDEGGSRPSTTLGALGSSWRAGTVTLWPPAPAGISRLIDQGFFPGAEALRV